MLSLTSESRRVEGSAGLHKKQQAMPAAVKGLLTFVILGSSEHFVRAGGQGRAGVKELSF